MRKSVLTAGLCLIAVLFAVSSSYPQSSKPSSGGGGDQTITKNTFVNLAQKVTPAVVNVINMKKSGIFGTTSRAGHGSGSIIDSKKGLVITNNHVVAGAESLMVTLNDKRSLKAKLIGTDPIFDVAVVQIENPPADLKQVAIGNSDKVQIGEWVVAMGFPGNLGYVVTSGNVVALGKEVPIGRLQQETIEYRGSYILIDAIINPGNSGGPLFNLNGEVVGINTVGLRISEVGGGYGGSIPINVAMDVKDKIMAAKDGKIIRAYFGLNGGDIEERIAARFNTTVDDLVKELNLKGPKGILILGAAEGSPAESVGFMEADVLIEFDGKKVDGLKDFRTIMEKLKPEQEVKLKYMRKGEEKTATVTLATMGGDKKSGGKQAPAEEDEE
jgi:S1-C subfamily serine protease